MLTRVNHDLAQCELVGSIQRVPQQGVRALASFQRRDVIRSVVEHARHGRLADEAEDVDRLRRFRIGGFQVFVAEHDVLVIAHREAAHDVLVVHRLAGGLVDLLITDARVIAAIEQIEIEFVRLPRRQQFNADVDEAKTKRSLPQCACHSLLHISGMFYAERYVSSADSARVSRVPVRAFANTALHRPRPASSPCAASMAGWM